MKDEGEAIAADSGVGRRNLMHQEDEKDLEEAVAKRDLDHDAHVMLPREAQGRIGQHLRRVYGEILSEPLPDKFSQLLDNLAKTERSE